MIGEIKSKLITTLHDRINPLRQVLHTMGVPGDVGNIDLAAAFLVFLAAVCVVKRFIVNYPK
jgi:hypothetical protein